MKAIKNSPKGHTKNRPFVFCIISKDRIYHIISSIVEFSEQFLFDSDVSKFMVDNSVNEHIFSEEDMFTDNIYPIISNLVATIGENISFQKVLVQLSGPVPMMR